MRHPYIDLRKLGLQVENRNSYFLQNIRRPSNCALKLFELNKDFFGGAFELTWDNTLNLTDTFCKYSV
jgi:hypothetical protein